MAVDYKKAPHLCPYTMRTASEKSKCREPTSFKARCVDYIIANLRHIVEYISACVFCNNSYPKRTTGHKSSSA
ncbi:MAG: hypothetical protein IJ218_02755 [Alphaproteobacteria bacterium]|nr:hypothetical protein [Alphaproteobacteria bacterium]